MKKDRARAGAARRSAAAQGPVASHAQERLSGGWKNIGLYLLLVIAILSVYGRAWNFDFVSYDDPRYVTQNIHVRTGLSAENVAWAFTSTYGSVWIPLAHISQMLDCQLFGLQSGWHHLMNILIHTLSTLLLFGLLHRMTGSLWRSALVAFIFGLHPLRVESVAWIAERKDVLATFFWMLTLWCYTGYVRRPGFGAYARVAVSLTLALLSKQTTVMLPVVLLLLDVWPLKRIELTGSPASRLWPIVREKAPLFALSGAAAIATYLAASGGGAVESIPIGTRLANAFVSCGTYLVQIVYPVKLAVFYPYPVRPELAQATASAIAILGISWLVVRYARSSYAFTGWFWYLVTLLPVIGLVQAGDQAHADRFTYIPLIGVSIVLVWGLTDLAERWQRVPIVPACLAAVACAGCLILTWRQVEYWKDTESLFAHALAVTDGNYVAHSNYAVVLREKGDIEGAISHFRQAVQIRPDYPEAQTGLGAALLAEGRTQEAMPAIGEALRVSPSSSGAHAMLGTLLVQQGRIKEAAAEYQKALELDPDNAAAHTGLGSVLAQMGQTQLGQAQPGQTQLGQADDALRQLYAGVQLEPEVADRHYQLGVVLARMGRLNDAIPQLSEAIRLAPADPSANYNLAVAFASAGRMEEALNQFKRTITLKPGYANAELGVAKVLLSMDRNDEAKPHLERALQLDPNLREAQVYLTQFFGGAPPR
jgi:tetratricopeptide (TPR) repeat protein